MSREVKELIDGLKATSESQPKELENYMVESLITFNGDNCKILLDYINQLETNRDEAIEYSHKRLGFLENCVGGDVELIHTQISVHREYLKILERGKEYENI